MDTHNLYFHLSDFRCSSMGCHDRREVVTVFFSIVSLMLETGFLVQGDVLVLDNAPIHKHAETLAVIIDLLQSLGVGIVFLPTYSPEMNPCELVFAKLKNTLRETRCSLDLVAHVTAILRGLTRLTMENFYAKCVATSSY